MARMKRFLALSLLLSSSQVVDASDSMSTALGSGLHNNKALDATTINNIPTAKKSRAFETLSLVKGGATTNKKRAVQKRSNNNVDPLISWGDVGNALTVILSFVLLARTPFDLGECDPDTCELPDFDSMLDPCYVCDGFCISNPTDPRRNSHMLSLYSDFIFTVPLLWLRQNKALKSLGLDDFYLSNLKVLSVAGHGLAHWALSVLTLAGMEVENNSTTQNTVAVLLFLARFASAGTVTQLGNVLNQLRGKDVDTKAMNRLALENRRGNSLRTVAAPLLTGVSLALFTDATPPDEPGLVNYLVFGLTCFVFFEAGIPPAANNWIYSVAFSVLTTWIAVGLLGINTIQHSFTIVFTSAYLVSSLYQMFVWDKDTKRANPYPYAVSAWGSNLVTTLVGWLLALKCKTMRNFGGHVWYDFSISTSYFLIYFLVKRNAEKR